MKVPGGRELPLSELKKLTHIDADFECGGQFNALMDCLKYYNWDKTNCGRELGYLQECVETQHDQYARYRARWDHFGENITTLLNRKGDYDFYRRN